MVINIAKNSGTKYMMEFVQEYLDGKMDRLWFDQDFIHYLIECYPKMERENANLAECFNFYLAEEGFDQAKGLSDAAHKKLIRQQFNELKAVIRDGFC
jgi:hypothetical protein